MKFFDTSQEMAKTCHRSTIPCFSKVRDIQKAAILNPECLSYAGRRPQLEVCGGSEMMLVQGERPLVSFDMFVGFLWLPRLIV